MIILVDDDAFINHNNEKTAMFTPSAAALLGFIAWTLILLLVMEGVRTQLVMSGKVPANAFQPDNANLSPFMQRLTRAHANCLEGLPIFGGLLLVGIVTGNSAITDPLAYVFLACRVFQSSVHLASVSPAAVTVRFAAFAIQMVIGAYWTIRLVAAM